jgi:uncharacterized membrane protein
MYLFFLNEVHGSLIFVALISWVLNHFFLNLFLCINGLIAQSWVEPRVERRGCIVFFQELAGIIKLSSYNTFSLFECRRSLNGSRTLDATIGM